MDSGNFALAVERTIEFLTDTVEQCRITGNALIATATDDLQFYVRIRRIILSRGVASAVDTWATGVVSFKQCGHLLKFVNPDDFDFLYGKWVNV